ncbi:hypothetical protein J1605_011784 [Eschrichtius robustus]|uniref:Ig-like domain-containing protein n=1 Tax=Eschrichtius robustus TaxID=9764 RepID=A0AB34GKS1_ESCRO|nr:hypothetical protein J1605_011784 [Eschrichtius robustus]
MAELERTPGLVSQRSLSWGPCVRPRGRRHEPHSFGMKHNWSPSAPTLFPLVSCVSALSDENPVALGCLARDFLPSSISFSWSYQNDSGVSGQSIQSFPAILREGKYTASSQVLLPPSSIPQGSKEHLLCRVQHTSGNKSMRVPLPAPPPKYTVHSDPHVLTASLTSASKRTPPPTVSSATSRSEGSAPALTTPRTPVLPTSRTQTEARMPENPKDPCRECRNHTQPPRVYLLRPPLQDLWLQGEANFTCLAVGGDLQAARLSWEVAGQPQSGHKEEEATEHTNGSWSRSSHLALSRASWAKGMPVTCTLSGPGLQSPPAAPLATSFHQGTPGGGTQRPPAARLLPMPPARSVTGLLTAEASAPSKPAVRVLTVPGPLPPAEAAPWLLCEVSDFSPPGVLLTWLEGRREVDPSWSATAHPAAQPGNSSFHTWSVLRVPAFPGRAAATYTCVVRHEASRTLLGTSWSLDAGGESRGLGASFRAGRRRRAGGGGAAPEEPGSGDEAAACLESALPGPGGSGRPASGPPGASPVHTPPLALATGTPRRGEDARTAALTQTGLAAVASCWAVPPLVLQGPPESGFTPARLPVPQQVSS